jgi:N-acetylglutamate synthase-like GNAT family acetyltransferase
MLNGTPINALTLRLADVSEAPAIVGLIRCACREQMSNFKSNFADKNDVETLIANGLFLVAQHGEKLIGCAYLEPSIGATRLELLAVCPSRRRSGIGSQLLEVAEDLTRKMQCLYMHVRVMNLDYTMLMFCRRRGYIAFGIEPMPSEASPLPFHHLVAMSKQLDKQWHGF